jgi:hypothetical protein
MSEDEKMKERRFQYELTQLVKDDYEKWVILCFTIAISIIVGKPTNSYLDLVCGLIFDILAIVLILGGLRNLQKRKNSFEKKYFSKPDPEHKETP